MTKREEFGLKFYRTTTADGLHGNTCVSDDGDNFSRLVIISYLDARETQDLMREITKAMNSNYYEQYWTSDSVEAEDIELAYPNIIINGLSVSMESMFALLQEWLSFINS